MKLINVPIEPIEERYSVQWFNWFNSHLLAFPNVKFHNVVPKRALATGIRHGQFLDAVVTNHYKAQQLVELMELAEAGQLTDNVVVFFHDLWFPGLEMLAYVRDALGLKFKIVGCLHAGTYDKWDFLAQRNMAVWGQSLEESWFRIVDRIFVATEFHKWLLTETREVDAKKVKVTGFPLYPDFVPVTREPEMRLNRIIFPHRLAPEKRPECFEALQKRLNGGVLAGWDFLRTKDHWTNKAEYYAQLGLARIAVSFAFQETWGIAMQEATLCGCFPVVPDRLSYSEMYLDEFKYPPGTTRDGDVQGAAARILDIAQHPQDYIQALERQQRIFVAAGSTAIPTMIDELGELINEQAS